MMELLSPAGSPEAVIAAVQNGADAVYLGLGDFNARRGAHNFTPEEFEKAVRYCRLRGCRVYVTLNTLVNDREMATAVAAARLASDKGADAILVQDLGLAQAIRRAVPDIPLASRLKFSLILYRFISAKFLKAILAFFHYYIQARKLCETIVKKETAFKQPFLFCQITLCKE